MNPEIAASIADLRASNSYADAMLGAGVLHMGRTTFASGREADNKLKMERLHGHPEALRLVRSGLIEAVSAMRADGVCGVPNGARPFARQVASELDIPHIDMLAYRTPKDSPDEQVAGKKYFRFKNAGEVDKLAELARLVIIEDVTNRNGSVVQLLSVAGIGARTVGMVAMWRRGEPEEEEPLPEHLERAYLVEFPLAQFIAGKATV